MIAKTKKHSEAGMTVVEMLISIFIFMLIMGASTYLLSQIYKRYGFAMEQGMSVSQVQKAMKMLIEEIRRAQQAESGAYPIVSADDFDLVYYSNVDSDGETERVHYWLDGTSIRKGVTEPTGTPASYPAEDQAITTVADYVHNTALEPIFAYYDSGYPADTTNNPLPAPVAQINQIRMVKIDVYFNLDPLRAPDNIRLESFVEMRNLKDNW